MLGTTSSNLMLVLKQNHAGRIYAHYMPERLDCHLHVTEMKLTETFCQLHMM